MTCSLFPGMESPSTQRILVAFFSTSDSELCAAGFHPHVDATQFNAWRPPLGVSQHLGSCTQRLQEAASLTTPLPHFGTRFIVLYHTYLVVACVL